MRLWKLSRKNTSSGTRILPRPMLVSTAAPTAVADPPLRARIQSTDSHKDSEAMRKPRVGSRNMTSNAPAITPPAWTYVVDDHVAAPPGLRPPLPPESE